MYVPVYSQLTNKIVIKATFFCVKTSNRVFLIFVNCKLKSIVDYIVLYGVY